MKVECDINGNITYSQDSGENLYTEESLPKSLTLEEQLEALQIAVLELAMGGTDL